METDQCIDSEVGTDSSEPLAAVDVESRKPQHMAFTIHFADANKNSATTKFIQDKVCNYTRHRRNRSLPPTEENKFVTKAEVNTVLAADSLPPCAGTKFVGTRRPGNHSEGYFSSDQDEDLRNRSGCFVRKFKNFEKGFRTTNLAQEKKIMADQTSQSKLHNSPHMRRHELRDYLVEELTHKSRLEELKCLSNAANNAGTLNSRLNDELSKDEWLQAATCDDDEDSSPIADEQDVDNEFCDDAASEAGTYTIDRDIACPEEDQARQEVAAVVGGKLNPNTEGTADEDFKMSSYRNGTNWINDWATQVAKHSHHPEPPDPIVCGLPPLPVEKHKAPSSLTTRIPSPIHGVSPTLPPTGRRPHAPPSPSRTPRSPLHLPSAEMTDRHGDSSFDTESYLRATESVVTAMQARMSLSVDSGGESEPDMSQSFKAVERGRSVGNRQQLQRRSSGASDSSARRANNKTVMSDSGSESSEIKMKKEGTPPPMRYNRAFSLRRARLDSDQAPVTPPADSRKKKLETVPAPIYKPKTPVEPIRPNASLQSRTTKPAVPKPEPAKTFSRTDCGRFSVRTPKTASHPPSSAKPSVVIKKDVKKDAKKTGGRSNSSLSSREVDFQNWKRRKSYDPMKAAAEGKKKDAAKKATFSNSMTQSYTTAEELSPSHSQQNSVLRSASFHGTIGMAPKYTSSEEEAALSAEEEEDLPSNEYICALPPVAGSPTKSSTDGALGGSRVSLHSTGTASNSSFKGRTKPEALDSLVMAALSGLSNKLRGRSCILLKKLRYLYEEDIEKSEQLSAIIDVLECPTNPGSPQGKSASKELSDTLKNLKRLESVIHVLDEVLFDDEDFDELNADQFQ